VGRVNAASPTFIPVIKMPAAREKILELCSEDDYGVWELFWAVAPFLKKENQEQNPEILFIQLIRDFIDERLIVSKIKNQTTNQLKPVAFDTNTLTMQLKKLANPDPESFYWFGLPA
jgi:hypothetical protein